MTTKQLKDILHQHKLWLLDRSTGKGADLEGANLKGADLRGANLRSANLRSADLRSADLEGADLDFSCFPLWCGGKNIITDRSLPLMLSAFICSMKVEDEEIKTLQALLLPYAQKSHRAEDIL
jgi:hypothetical protein